MDSISLMTSSALISGSESTPEMTSSRFDANTTSGPSSSELYELLVDIERFYRTANSISEQDSVTESMRRGE